MILGQDANMKRQDVGYCDTLYNDRGVLTDQRCCCCWFLVQETEEEVERSERKCVLDEGTRKIEVIVHVSLVDEVDEVWLSDQDGLRGYRVPKELWTSLDVDLTSREDWIPLDDVQRPEQKRQEEEKRELDELSDIEKQLIEMKGRMRSMKERKKMLSGRSSLLSCFNRVRKP